VVEKHDFQAIQQKIPQISDFAKKQDSNPLPHGDIADDIAKMFAKIFSQKLDFALKNTIFAKIRLDFCKIPRTLSRKSDSAKNFFHDFRDFSATLRFSQKNNSSIISAKIGFCKNLFSRFSFCKKCQFLRKMPIFAKNANFCENTNANFAKKLILAKRQF
jgi:hypothetical protein